MKLSFHLRAMAALLRQGRKAHAVSLGLLGLAGLWLLLDALFVVHAFSPAGAVLAWLSLATGIAQLYYAIRVDFDAGLVDALAGYAPLLPEDTTPTRQANADAELAALLDRSLESLGLVDAGLATRDWPSRWRGMRGLLRRQFACVAVQALLLAAAWAVAAFQVAGAR